jgi:hypothetical protein
MPSGQLGGPARHGRTTNVGPPPIGRALPFAPFLARPGPCRQGRAIYMARRPALRGLFTTPRPGWDGPLALMIELLVGLPFDPHMKHRRVIPSMKTSTFTIQMSNTDGHSFDQPSNWASRFGPPGPGGAPLINGADPIHDSARQPARPLPPATCTCALRATRASGAPTGRVLARHPAPLLHRPVLGPLRHRRRRCRIATLVPDEESHPLQHHSPCEAQKPFRIRLSCGQSPGRSALKRIIQSLFVLAIPFLPSLRVPITKYGSAILISFRPTIGTLHPGGLC